MKRRRGFTLIEMVVVVAIIGIIASVSLLKFSKAQEKARDNADYATAANIATAAYLVMDEGKEVTMDSVGEYLESTPDEKFTLEVKNKRVTVKKGDDVIYPKPKEAKKQ